MKVSSALLSAVVVAGTASLASAGLVVNLARPSGTGPLSVNPGETVTLNIVASIDDSNSNTGFQNAFGRIVTTGALKANVQSALFSSTFSGSNHQDSDSPTLATLADLDADGDIDIGSTNNAASAGWLSARSGAIELGNSFNLGTVTFTIPVDAVQGSTALAAWERRVSNGSALWREGTSVFTGSTSGAELYSVGGGVQLQVVPEPASLAVVGLAAAGLLARRRRRA